MIFEKAIRTDLDAIGKLYDDLCDYLVEHNNYCKWRKGIYPTIEDAEIGLNEDNLYICKCGNTIVGTVILRHKPENGYDSVHWLTENDYSKIYVIYTLAVHPDYMGIGVAKYMMESIEKLAREEGCISIRLDVLTGNVPAENLYRDCHYTYIATKSLGYEMYGLPSFHLYENVL